jgi:hypothetical protein
VSQQPAFSKAGAGRYLLEIADFKTALDLSRVRRDRFGVLRGELTVSCGLPGAITFNGVVWSGEITLSDLRGRREILEQIRRRARVREANWDLYVDELATRVRDIERIGDAAVTLRELPRPEPDHLIDIDGFRVPSRHPSMLFADGGAGKSFYALYLAGRLEDLGLRVGFFDWELDAADHRRRLESVFGQNMPAVVYARCVRPLVQEVDRLARIIHDNGLDFAMVDSAAFAASGPPEASETATEYFRCVRELGIGTLSLAHVTKKRYDDKGDASEHRPFGSTFWHNGARATWFGKSINATSDHSFTLGMFNRKNNLGPLLPAVGYEVSFRAGETTFARTSLADVAELADKLSTFERIVSALKAGPLTVSELADNLDAKLDTVEKTVKRHTEKGRLIKLMAANGVPTRYGLAERRVS